MKNLTLLWAAVLACTCCNARVKEYTVNVLQEYPHDITSYTQGLFFHGSNFYESTGQWGESTFRVVDLRTGKPSRRLDFDRRYFVEGSVILDGKLYILTWTNNVAFIYDAATLEYKSTVKYPREGWGLTTDGKSLIASDGSNRLYFMDESFKVTRTLNVTRDGKPLKFLNELEWIDGKIWANIYTTDFIAIIDPVSGNVEGLIDCSALTISARRRSANIDVLNGIAMDPATSDIYLTGKHWPSLYRIEIKAK